MEPIIDETLLRSRLIIDGKEIGCEGYSLPDFIRWDRRKLGIGGASHTGMSSYCDWEKIVELNA